MQYAIFTDVIRGENAIFTIVFIVRMHFSRTKYIDLSTYILAIRGKFRDAMVANIRIHNRIDIVRCDVWRGFQKTTAALLKVSRSFGYWLSQ